jgi:transposase
LDLHRRQITFDYLDTVTGEATRGVLRPVTRESFREWLARLSTQEAAFAVEATTGWRFMVEELRNAGMEPHLAEPADTRALRGNKRRPKTDRVDARHLRDLLLRGTLPESWIPTAFISDLRSTVRLRERLVDQRSGWIRRIRAQCFTHGLADPPRPRSLEGQAWLAKAELPATARRVVDVAMEMIEVLDGHIDGLSAELTSIGRRQKGCLALQSLWGVGPLMSAILLAELGDVSRMSSSRKLVRFAGLDVTVSESDTKRSPGHLSRQGPPVLRRALYEASAAAWRVASPDHEYYVAAKARLGTKRARVSVSRRLLRRAYHLLANLGDAAIEPVA